MSAPFHYKPLYGADPRTQRFLNELSELCRRHGLRVAPEDYDRLQVWPIDEADLPIDASTWREYCPNFPA